MVKKNDFRNDDFRNVSMNIRENDFKNVCMNVRENNSIIYSNNNRHEFCNKIIS